jgi:hypothetical protein
VFSVSSIELSNFQVAHSHVLYTQCISAITFSFFPRQSKSFDVECAGGSLRGEETAELRRQKTVRLAIHFLRIHTAMSFLVYEYLVAAVLVELTSRAFRLSDEDRSQYGQVILELRD